MCGRYIIFTSEEYREMKAILREISKHYKTGIGTFAAGEIFPSMDVPVVFKDSGQTAYTMLKWGMELYGSKKLLINARSETLLERKTFRPLAKNYRCLFPANGFFEWKDRVKYLIGPSGLDTFYMAGLYNRDGRAVIITTSANNEMSSIHDRMPVLFDRETGSRWLEEYVPGILVPYDGRLDIRKAV